MTDDIEDAHQAYYHQFEPTEIETLRTALLGWYWKNRRKLPWRGDPPPYGNAEKPATNTKKAKVAADNSKSKSLLSFFGKSTSTPTKTTATKTTTTTSKLAPAAEAAPAAVGTPVSPYGVWVSEIMLQQTRVEAVIDYYLAFMKAFPTVQALSSADLEEVNRLWAGLGYYRRAKMLHDGAIAVVNEHEGNVPNTVEGLKSIPGIGAYTAGAVGSIAFQIRTPLVDGNVIRVLSRVRALAADPKNKQLVALCWTLAEALVSPTHPGDFNQALMELGATLCSVTSPRCSECPLRTVCLARKEVEAKQRPVGKPDTKGDDLCEVCSAGSAKGPSSVTEYPQKAEKKEPTPETYVVVVLTSRSVKGHAGTLCYFLRKRPETGLLAGQWEFPSFLITDAKQRKAVFDSGVQELFEGEEFTTTSRRSCGEIVHVFSHRKHTMLIEAAEITSPLENPTTTDAESQSKKRKLSSTTTSRWYLCSLTLSLLLSSLCSASLSILSH